ncbi:MAG: phage tail protein [Candidatus Aminicenantes bacterium]|nr:phage tail protein [Candidatus Aminicenantes bacterium]
MRFSYKVLIVLVILIMTSSIAALAPESRPHDPIGQFHFRVEIDGITTAAFKVVEGLESSSEVVEYRSGMDPFLRKMPGITKYSNIILKRGYVTNDELWNWRKKVVEGNIERKSGSIVITRSNREQILRIDFYDAWPVRWKLSTLDSMGNECLIEELEIAVEKLERYSIKK